MRQLVEPRLLAGVVDSSVASAATFAAGLTGVRLLSDIDRGVYGVYFTAFFLGSVIVTELVLVPSQVVAVDLPRPRRLDVARRSLKLGLVPAIWATSAAFAAAGLTQDLTTTQVIAALTTTTAATIVVSPMQDHVRQLLHIAERSWAAVVVSCVQAAGVLGTIAVLMTLDVGRAWIPFGSLAVANTLSLAAGLILTGRRQSPPDPLIDFLYLARSGKWLVMRAATPAAFGFAAANIVTRLAGPEAYGYAEAARQVAQPITVLSIGLLAVLGPNAIRAGSQGEAAAGSHNRRRYATFMLLGAIGYGLLFGTNWAFNPMVWLVPAAFVVTGLVAVTIVANALIAAFVIYARELLGAGQARALAVISVIAAPALPIAATTAGATEAFARPLGYVLEGVIRVLGVRWRLRKHYADRALASPAKPPRLLTE